MSDKLPYGLKVRYVIRRTEHLKSHGTLVLGRRRYQETHINNTDVWSLQCSVSQTPKGPLVILTHIRLNSLDTVQKSRERKIKNLGYGPKGRRSSVIDL